MSATRPSTVPDDHDQGGHQERERRPTRRRPTRAGGCGRVAGSGSAGSTSLTRCARRPRPSAGDYEGNPCTAQTGNAVGKATSVVSGDLSAGTAAFAGSFPTMRPLPARARRHRDRPPRSGFAASVAIPLPHRGGHRRTARPRRPPGHPLAPVFASSSACSRRSPPTAAPPARHSPLASRPSCATTSTPTCST